MKRIIFRKPEAPNCDRIIGALFHGTIAVAICLIGLLITYYTALL